MVNLEIGTSTSITLGSEYEVFLNFRGPDTRLGFTSLLYRALDSLGIRVFMDEEDLQEGEIIGDNLVRAIDDSKLYIPIFSKTYASSRWCLRELAKMVENIPKSKEEGKEKIILPIFYDVKRNDLKLETGLYCTEISNLEREMNDQKKDVSDVPKWRQALQDVCCAEGWEREQFDSDGDLIELIVQKVVVILKIRQRHVTKDSVGMKDRIADIYNLLDIDSSDVRVIGIYGMSGIGKTTLAKTIFNKLCPHFGRNCCFLEDIRERAKTEGLEELQKVLVSDICHFGVARKVDDSDHGIKTMGKTIYDKKVLIVLDDVDNYLQVEQLIGQKHLYPGTRILVTARDESVLESINGLAYEVKPYCLKGLSIKDALELFSRHAFDERSPPKDYYDFSIKIVSTTGGLPLALELMGSLLFSEENKEVWKEKLEKLRKTSDDDVLGKLRISYETLLEGQREIFLDIACFFVGQEKTYPMYIWTDCGFAPKEAIDVLTRRFIIRVTDNKFWMHSLLRDLGRKIVEAGNENEGPPGNEVPLGMRTRLWARKDIIRALKSTEIKGKVQALRLAALSNLEKDSITVTSDQIRRFPQLRFLWLSQVTCEGKFTDCLSELKWIDMQYGYSIPPPRGGGHQWFEAPEPLHLEKVVVVKLHGLDLTKDVLESLIKEAKKLKVLAVSYNTFIHGTLTFPENSALEKLAICDFLSLTEIDRSIEKLKVLTDLSFERCVQLQKLPRQIGRLRNLEQLSVKFCDLIELPHTILKLKKLTNLDVSCTEITRLPDNIGELSSLSSVDASSTSIEKLPITMGELPKLQILLLDHCDRIQELPKLPSSLTTLRVRSNSLLTVPNLSDLPGLVELALSDGSQLKARSTAIQTCDLQWIGNLTKLEKLHFCFSNVYAPTTELGSLSLLKELILHGLDVPTFQQLPPDLVVLELYDTRGKEVRLDKLPPSEKETEFVPSSSTESKREKVLKQLERFFIQENDSSEGKVLELCDTRGKEVRLDKLPPSEKETEFVSSSSTESLRENVLKQLERFFIQENDSSEGKVLELCDTRGKEVRLDKLPPSEKETEFVSSSSTESMREKVLKQLERFFIQENDLSEGKVLELYDTRGKEVRLDKLPPPEKETEFVSSSSTESMREKVLKQLESQFIQLNDSSVGNVRLREEPGCSELQAPELIGHWRGDFLLPSPLRKLQKFVLWGCPDVQEIRFDSTSKYLFVVSVTGCTSLKRLGGLSELNFLEELTLKQCPSLQVVEGIDELKFLHKLEIHGCTSLQRIFDEPSSKIPYQCQISISCSGKLHDSRPANGTVTWGSYIKAPDPEAEAMDSETETEDPSRNTGNEDAVRLQFYLSGPFMLGRRSAMVEDDPIALYKVKEPEESERESATGGALYINSMSCDPENLSRDDHKEEEEEQRRKSWSYYS